MLRLLAAGGAGSGPSPKLRNRSELIADADTWQCVGESSTARRAGRNLNEIPKNPSLAIHLHLRAIMLKRDKREFLERRV